MYNYMLERAEPYIVKTEQLKNRTCESYRWKQVAMSNDLESLKKLMGNEHRIINWNTLETICQTYRR